MKDEKKSVIEEALAEFTLIQENLNSNTKEILRSVAKEEITSTLKESLYEDDYDIEDIEDVDAEPEMGADVDALPVDDAPEAGLEPEMGMEPEGGSEELGIDDIGMDTADGDLGLGAEEGSEDYGMDMTGASDEEVISVYKKLSGEDEIEVVSPNEVIIKDPNSGAEYNVKMGGGSLIDQGEMSADDLGSEMDLGIDAEMDVEPEIGVEPEMDTEVGPEMDSEESEEEVPAPAMGGEESEESEGESEEEEEEEMEESVVYEIELSEDEAIEEGIENDLKINKDSKIGATADGKPRTATSDVTSKGGSLPTGDIEGQNAPNDSDSGDNLDGGFTEDHNGSGDAHAPHVMESEEVVETETIEETDEVTEEVVEEEDTIEEHIPKGQGEAHRMPAKADIGQPVAPGAKGVKGVKGENVESKKLVEAISKYNTLLSEAKELKKENDMFRNSLKDFRKSITETAVFNTNLTHATKLFLEHSTTSVEKQNILSRFDEEVSTIEESKKLYKAISSELGNKTPITEGIENKLVSDKTSSQSAQLNETTAYVDPAQKRVLDLIRRTR